MARIDPAGRPARDRRADAALLLLAAATALSAALLLASGRELSFSGDELNYYGRLVPTEAGGAAIAPSLDLEYLLTPHNGHLTVVGKLVYEAVFAIAGPSYAALRTLSVAGVMLCVWLFYVIARRRIGPVAALAPSLVLLFIGSAWEVLLWPFDIHTTLALAAGLGALILLERGGRYADPCACALLVVGVATLELGLAFVAAVAVTACLRPDRARRAWVFVLPLVLYGIWYLWARKFGGGDLALANLGGLLPSIADSFAAVMVSIFGLVQTGDEVAVFNVGPSAWGAALGAVALIGLGFGLRRGAGSVWMAAFSTVLLIWWSLVGLADRPPDSVRYVFVAAVLVLLIAADAARGVRWTRISLICLFCVAALALPANIAKLADGRRHLESDANLARTQYAMLELAGDRVAATYRPATDPGVAEVIPPLGLGLDAGSYLAAADRFGSIAYPLDEVRGQAEPVRRAADITLANALGLELEGAPPPAGNALDGCEEVAAPPGAEQPAVEFEPGEVLIGAPDSGDVEISLGRFAPEKPSAALGTIGGEGLEWARLTIPPDAADDPWRLRAGGPIVFCLVS